MIERKIEKSCKAWARRRRWWVRKFTSPAQRAVPDDIFAKYGKVIWVEFKATGKKPTALQEDEHRQMRAAGLTVVWFDSIEGFKSYFEPLDAFLDDLYEDSKQDRVDYPKWKGSAHSPVQRMAQLPRKNIRKTARRQRRPSVERAAKRVSQLGPLSRMVS